MFTNLKLCFAAATHNYEWVIMTSFIFAWLQILINVAEEKSVI